MDVTFHEHVSFFTRPQLQGESDSNSNLEPESELEFLFLGPWQHESPVTDLVSPAPSPTSVPNVPPISPSTTIPNVPPVSSVLEETIPSAPTNAKAGEPTLVYQRRSKSNLPQTQLQLPEPEVSTEVDPPTSDSHSSDNSDTDTDDLPIALRKGKRSCAKYPISQFVSTNNLSVQYQSFISAVDTVIIP